VAGLEAAGSSTVGTLIVAKVGQLQAAYRSPMTGTLAATPTS